MTQRPTLSNLLLSLGIVCFLLAVFFTWQRHTSQRLSSQQQPAVGNLQPTTAIIKDLKIAVPIYPVSLENGQWPTTPKGIFYLIDSATPGETGNSILYGHNWPNLLGALPQARRGQEIQIQRANGEIKRFVIIKTAIVTPDQTHVLSPSQDSRLTLYTCTGFLDQKRFVVTAAPIYRQSN